jgi:hypothetical protein
MSSDTDLKVRGKVEALFRLIGHQGVLAEQVQVYDNLELAKQEQWEHKDPLELARAGEPVTWVDMRLNKEVGFIG